MSETELQEVPEARRALSAFGIEGELRPIDIGLINRTYQVETPGTRFILQRVNPIFGAAVHRDIEAITERLAEHDVLTPRLVHTPEGARCAEIDGAIYRVLTFIEGEVHHELREPSQAASVGALVASFHRALVEFEHTFAFTRPGAHVIAKHMETLRDALEAHREHPRYSAVEPTARAILNDFRALPKLPPLPTRIIHGDLKITNIMFESAPGGEAIALLDLDTMAHDTLAVEMGDALRSWCNPAGESDPHAELDLALYRAATGTYLDGAAMFLTEEEIDAIPLGLETIALELSSRFCADALNESYFGWDRERFESASHHNLVRARSQLGLSRSVKARRDELG